MGRWHGAHGTGLVNIGCSEPRHGGITLIRNFVPVVCIAMRSDPAYDQIKQMVRDFRHKGAALVVLTDDGNTDFAGVAHFTLFCPATKLEMQPLISCIPLQLLLETQTLLVKRCEKKLDVLQDLSVGNLFETLDPFELFIVVPELFNPKKSLVSKIREATCVLQLAQLARMAAEDAEAAGLECELLGKWGSFGWWLQVFLGAVCMASLIGKRFTDKVRRSWKVWFFDTAKQGTQALMNHIINIGLSMGFGEWLEVDADPCNWYWINMSLDCTLGVAIMFLLLRTLQCVYRSKCVARPELARCGHYGDPPDLKIFFRQLLDWQEAGGLGPGHRGGGRRPMTNYVRFPNVTFEPVELQVGLGEVFRSVTPSFLRKEEASLGLLLQASSFGSLTRALLGHPGRFALTYTLGNIVALVGTFFLAGPRKQVRKMADKNRAHASAIFVSAMVLTLVAVEAPRFHGRALLILALVILQWMSLVWYTLSYIPYGQKMGWRLLTKCLSLRGVLLNGLIASKDMFGRIADLALVIVQKLLLAALVINFRAGLAAFASALLGWLDSFPRAKLVVVMVLMPVVLNVFALWTADSFLQANLSDGEELQVRESLVAGAIVGRDGPMLQVDEEMDDTILSFQEWKRNGRLA
eukprot:s2735_g15.t1